MGTAFIAIPINFILILDKEMIIMPHHHHHNQLQVSFQEQL